jgi:choline dehydrogenase-like flavoprotein
MGNYGWSYDDVLPYFIKSEDNKNPKYAATKYHGIGGYLTVGEAPFRTPLAEAFIKAGEELGYDETDGNGESQTGKFLFIIISTCRNSSLIVRIIIRIYDCSGDDS